MPLAVSMNSVGEALSTTFRILKSWKVALPAPPPPPPPPLEPVCVTPKL